MAPFTEQIPDGQETAHGGAREHPTVSGDGQQNDRGNQNQPAAGLLCGDQLREHARVLWEPFADNCPDRHP